MQTGEFGNRHPVLEFEQLTTKSYSLEVIMNECIIQSQRREGLISLFEGQGEVTRKFSQSSSM